MGLDIAFNRQQAVEAGLIIEMIAREGNYSEDDDPEYIEWCKSVVECIQIPNRDHFVENDSADELSIVVRANKWGHSYDPLTTWLKSNNIKWSEF